MGFRSSGVKRVKCFCGTAKRYMCTKYETEATFETKPYKLYMLDEGPALQVTLTRNNALDYYRQMFTIRRLETAAARLYQLKIIRGFCHLYSGQEAVAVGLRAAMRPDDCVITSYRAHGWCYLMGVPVINILSELTGKKTGSSRGKGGSMHMFTNNFFGGNGIVGAQVPIGVGIALALKMQGKEGTCFTLYGDGAANQGQVFESFNIAALWGIPCIFICENNLYGMGTTVDRSSADTAFYKRSHHIPGIHVEGMDILTVLEAGKFALNYVTTNKAPIVLETATYRYYGHSMSDPGTSYRKRNEIENVRNTMDPILKFKEKILTKNLALDVEIRAIETEIKNEMAHAVEVARAAQEPGIDDLTSDIYAKSVEESIRNVSHFQNLVHKNYGKPKNY